MSALPTSHAVASCHGTGGTRRGAPRVVPRDRSAADRSAAALRPAAPCLPPGVCPKRRLRALPRARRYRGIKGGPPGAEPASDDSRRPCCRYTSSGLPCPLVLVQAPSPRLVRLVAYESYPEGRDGRRCYCGDCPNPYCCPRGREPDAATSRCYARHDGGRPARCHPCRSGLLVVLRSVVLVFHGFSPNRAQWSPRQAAGKIALAGRPA